MQLTKSEMYNLYSQVFNKLEQKENLIENYIRQKNTGNQEEQPSSNMGTVSTRNFPVYQLIRVTIGNPWEPTKTNTLHKDGIYPITPKDTDNKTSTSATLITMKFLSTNYFF